MGFLRFLSPFSVGGDVVLVRRGEYVSSLVDGSLSSQLPLFLLLVPLGEAERKQELCQQRPTFLGSGRSVFLTVLRVARRFHRTDVLGLG